MTVILPPLRTLLCAIGLGVLAAGAAPVGAAPPTKTTTSSNWAADAELDGIVDLLDPDYLQHPINVARLPLKYAVTLVHGRGSDVVYSFEDPNCGYCRELTRRLEEIGNITVHTYVITFLGPDSRLKADAVWCAKDKGRAWRLTMNQRAVAPAGADCRAPTEATMKLAGMLGINLTPTVFFADGSRMNGVKPRAEIEARLRKAALSRVR